MNEWMIGVPSALLLFLLLFRLLKPSGRAARDGASSIGGTLDDLHLLHCAFSPQILQALSSTDEAYLRERVPAKVAERARRERRAVAKQFLAGLREDYVKLERLGRMIAALSPEISRQQEAERLVIGIRFRLLYVWVWLRLSTGRVPLRQIEHLARLVGRLSLRMEQAMAAIGAASAQGFSRGFSG
jgi:hypothetical protein